MASKFKLISKGSIWVPYLGNDGDQPQSRSVLSIATMKRTRKRLAGLTLTELVCVIAVIALLASLYIGVIIRAFVRVVKFLKGM
jgi:prepilin-type N-terminal cleavage/methylation domain-containing protein